MPKSISSGYSVSSVFPFEVTLTVSPSNPSLYMATIYPGVVNGNLFCTINSVPMWQYVSNGGTPPSFALPVLNVSKGNKIFIKGTVTAGIISALEIDANSTLPTETDSITTYTIATVDPITGALTQILKSNLAYAATATIYSPDSRLIAHVWNTAP